MQLKLPVYSTPITTYPHAANLASILWGNDKIYPWLMNYFIKAYGWHVDENDYNMDYEDFYILDCPAIFLQRIDVSMILKGWKNIITFIKDAIQCGYYIYMIADTSKISAYHNSGMGLHDLFLYGYDDILNEVYIADCFKDGKYSFSYSSFDEILDAFPYNQITYEDIFEFHNDIMLIKANPQFDVGFQPIRVKQSLEDYLNAIPGSYTYSRLKLDVPSDIHFFYFGKKCWDIIYNDINYSTKHDGLAPHCLRVFHLMYEMKRIMCIRLAFMMQNNFIKHGEKFIDTYKKIQTEFLKCQNMMLKYSFYSKKELLLKIYFNLKKLEQIEEFCIPEIIDSIII